MSRPPGKLATAGLRLTAIAPQPLPHHALRTIVSSAVLNGMLLWRSIGTLGSEPNTRERMGEIGSKAFLNAFRTILPPV
jgi:hypothetical protein